jgi:serine/threonine protein phosphatase PrpC
MEDYTGFAQINPKVSVFYVIDGHGGPDLAEMAAEDIPDMLRESEAIKQEQYRTAIEDLFESLDGDLKTQSKRASMIREKHGLSPLVDKIPTSGLSMVLALISDDEITIANLGECKCYVCYRANLSKAVLISGNHTETHTEDESRVKNAGGFFVNGKVNGMLPFTRSIGDYAFKNNEASNSQQQLLIPTPSIFTLRKEDMKTIVLGSCGLWEFPELVMREVTEDDCELGDLKQKTEKMLENLISKDPRGSDKGLQNMAIGVIDLKK